MKPLSSGTLAESVDERELSKLMRAAQSGDAAAYRELLIRVQTMAESFVKNSLFRSQAPAGAAEDISQEIMLALHAKRHTYDPSQFFLPWFYAIARYKVIDSFRNAKKCAANLEFNEDSLSLSFASTLEERSSSGLDTKALLADLPPKQREILELVKIEGLSVAEAATRTGCSESDIKVTIHRALKALRQKIGGV